MPALVSVLVPLRTPLSVSCPVPFAVSVEAVVTLAGPVTVRPLLPRNVKLLSIWNAFGIVHAPPPASSLPVPAVISSPVPSAELLPTVSVPFLSVVVPE